MQREDSAAPIESFWRCCFVCRLVQLDSFLFILDVLRLKLWTPLPLLLAPCSQTQYFADTMHALYEDCRPKTSTGFVVSQTQYIKCCPTVAKKMRCQKKDLEAPIESCWRCNFMEIWPFAWSGTGAGATKGGRHPSLPPPSAHPPNFEKNDHIASPYFAWLLGFACVTIIHNASIDMAK